MLKPKQHNIISEEAYLSDELISEIKHECIDGDIYAVAGSSKNHQRITMNVSWRL